MNDALKMMIVDMLANMEAFIYWALAVLGLTAAAIFFMMLYGWAVRFAIRTIRRRFAEGRL